PQIPDPEWDHIIREQPVDLDSIFQSVTGATPSVSSSSSQPLRTICSSGDWSIAWDQASEGISFAFPH
ncbi:hypothetical protein BDQ17DRAFT_1256923, partial [Cyathus striatus]